MSNSDVNISRRSFVEKSATAAAALTIAPGIFLHTVAEAKPADQAITSAVRWGMLIDTAKCASGCTACVSACNTENGIASHDRPRTDQQWIRKVTLRDKQTKHEVSLPMMCQHCD